MTSKRLASLAVAAALLGTATGCYSTTLNYGSRQYDGHGARHRVVVNNIFWGLESIGRVDLEEYCTETQIQEVRNRITVVGAVVRALTIGFYTPITVRVTCTPPTPVVGDEGSVRVVAQADYDFVPVGEQPARNDTTEPPLPDSTEPEHSEPAPAPVAVPEENPYD